MAYKDIKVKPKEPGKLAKDFQDLIDEVGRHLYDKLPCVEQTSPFDPTIAHPQIPPFGSALNHPCARCQAYLDSLRTGKILTCSCAIPAMHNIQYSIKG